MTEAYPWEVLEEIGYTHHLTVWFAVLELEADDAERINSPSTSAAVAELTGEIRWTDSILLSLDRLTEAGVLEKSEVTEWPGRHDWRTTERGRRIAEAFVGEWGRVLEGGDTSNSDTADD